MDGEWYRAFPHRKRPSHVRTVQESWPRYFQETLLSLQVRSLKLAGKRLVIVIWTRRINNSHGISFLIDQGHERRTWMPAG